MQNDPQPYGFVDFPRDYGEKYFDMLTAEEKMADGSYESHGRRNESLDNMVYAMCAGDVYLASEVERHRLTAINKGFPYRLGNILVRSKDELTRIDKRLIIDLMIPPVLGRLNRPCKITKFKPELIRKDYINILKNKKQLT